MTNKLYFIYGILVLLSLNLLSSCSYKSRQAILKTPFDTDTIKTVRVVNGSENTDDYYNIIKPEDELIIRNLQDMNLIMRQTGGDNTSNSNQYQQNNYTPFKVNKAGELLLPKIGVIKIAGLNRIEAAAKVQHAYEATELVAPLIEVRIANAYITLLGEVGRQGKYIIGREDYELIDLLGDAGGITPNANRKMVRIIRGDRSNPEIILVNLNDYDFVKNPHLKLRNRDIVYVEPRRVVATNQNLQAYTSLLQVGLVVFNTLLLIYNLAKK
jgi:polysaccharide export outer membrane protein